MATRIIGQELTAIIGLVNNATDGFLTSKTPSVKGANVVRRQANTQAVAAIIGLILSEISGSLTSIKNGLGIGKYPSDSQICIWTPLTG
jgi:hypothetical protein